MKTYWMIPITQVGDKPREVTTCFHDEIKANKEASINRVVAAKLQIPYDDKPPVPVYIVPADTMDALVATLKAASVGIPRLLKLASAARSTVERMQHEDDIERHAMKLRNALAAFEGRE